MTNTYRRIMAVATGQLGLLSRRQANGVGVTNAQLRSRVSSGSLLQVGADTFRLPGAPSSALADLRALMLDIGGEVWASGPTAAALHGFDGYRLKPPFDVTILRGRDVKRIGHRVHTTASLALIDRAVRRGYDVSERGADTDRSRPNRESSSASPWPSIRACATESSTSRSCTVGSSRCARKAGLAFLDLLDAIEGAEAIRGGHSWLEREYLRLRRGGSAGPAHAAGADSGGRQARPGRLPLRRAHRWWSRSSATSSTGQERSSSEMPIG